MKPTTPADQFIIDSARWTENPPRAEAIGDLPYATHSGELELFGVTIKCHRLSNGQTIIEAESMAAIFEMMGLPDGDESEPE